MQNYKNHLESNIAESLVNFGFDDDLLDYDKKDVIQCRKYW